MPISEFGLGAAFFLIFLCAGAAEPTLDQLKKNADAILQRDVVAARGDVGIVFETADRLAAAARLQEANHYYEGGLRIEPHDFGHHLLYARSLLKLNQTPEADEQLHIILNGCEDQTLTSEASTMLGQPPPQISALGQLPSRGAVLVLIPMGDVDLLLLQQERSQLQKELGIKVEIRSVPCQTAGPSRSNQRPMANTLRLGWQRLRVSNPDGFDMALERYGLTAADLDNDWKVFQFSAKFFRDGGDVQHAQEIDQILGKIDGQWDAADLLTSLTQAVTPMAQNNVRYIGITSHDIFAQDYNYLFGWSTGNCAIVSYKRFTASFNGEIPNRTRLLRRFHFQCLASAGHVFGLPRCTDPTCPRSYPNSLEEQDAKSDQLSEKCRHGFAVAFAQYGTSQFTLAQFTPARFALPRQSSVFIVGLLLLLTSVLAMVIATSVSMRAAGIAGLACGAVFIASATVLALVNMTVDGASWINYGAVLAATIAGCAQLLTSGIILFRHIGTPGPTNQ
jgi:predicted Zn-dependent protease